MRGLRITTVALLGLMLLLPPRWCCALPPGMGPCGAGCQSTPGTPCCACSKKETSKDAPQGPCKCVCKGSTAKVDKSPSSPEIALLAPLGVAPALVLTLEPQCVAPLPEEQLPPLDVQTMLRRWRC